MGGLTSRQARRHIGEWGDFFSDMNEVSEKTIGVFLKSRREKRYLKQSLRRLKKRGFVIEESDKLSLTSKGRKFFHRFRLRKDSKANFSPLKWDRKWRLVTFDVPVRDKGKRDQLRSLLKDFGFYKLQESVWICPNQQSEDFWKLLIEYKLNKYCHIMMVDILEGDEEIRKHYHLASS